MELIIYFATLAAAAAAFPLWGWTISRIADRYNQSERAQWTTIYTGSVAGGALVALVPTVILAVYG